MAAFSLTRSVRIDAPAERVRALVDDFRQWQQWSPWEDLDPQLSRTYTGPERGVGAHYAWAGNKKAGEGTMEITSSTPEAVEVALSFLKPWKATNAVRIAFTAEGGATAVDWTMSGQHTAMSRIFYSLFGMDKKLSADFDRGLARLKESAERG